MSLYITQEAKLMNHINDTYDLKRYETKNCKRVALGKIVTDKITGKRKLICYDLLGDRIIEQILN